MNSMHQYRRHYRKIAAPALLDDGIVIFDVENRVISGKSPAKLSDFRK